jgi:hypothetical protein
VAGGAGMIPWDVLNQFVDWIMLSPDREWFMFGMLVGMFMMFSILTGYWIAGTTIRKIMRWK